MKNKFDIEEVKKMARLSALELTDKELIKFGDQFSAILEYFDLLNEIEMLESDTELFETYNVDCPKLYIYNKGFTCKKIYKIKLENT